MRDALFHFLVARARFLAKIVEHISINHLQIKEVVGPVFDELRFTRRADLLIGCWRQDCEYQMCLLFILITHYRQPDDVARRMRGVICGCCFGEELWRMQYICIRIILLDRFGTPRQQCRFDHRDLALTHMCDHATQDTIVKLVTD